MRLRGTHKYGSFRAVKTTLEIPDPLFRKAKATSARQGRTMKEFVNEALAEKLAAGANGGSDVGWRAVLGTLSPEAKKAAREVDAVIQGADFNNVDAEMWR